MQKSREPFCIPDPGMVRPRMDEFFKPMNGYGSREGPWNRTFVVSQLLDGKDGGNPRWGRSDSLRLQIAFRKGTLKNFLVTIKIFVEFQEN